MASQQSITKIADIIEVNHGKPMVSSLTIAEIFERPHFRVIKSIVGLIARGTLTPAPVVSSWVDSTGRSNPIYYLDERQSLIAMPFIGGAKAEEGQIKLVDAYLFYRNNFSDPPRAGLLADKRKANRPMTDAIVEFREALGKLTDERHYMCEAKLCNFIVTGMFAGIDEASLSNEDAVLLAGVRRRNESLLYAGIDYAERKRRLTEYSIRIRTKRIA